VARLARHGARCGGGGGHARPLPLPPLPPAGCAVGGRRGAPGLRVLRGPLSRSCSATASVGVHTWCQAGLGVHL
ncbi:hypothetical protein T484DRAFT_1891043, partial [Baffinella frigidus]